MSAEKKVRTPKQQRSIEKTDLIKKTALRLFSENGYFKTTTNDIAKNAGLSIGTLYSYFKDKKDIYEELVKEHYYGAAEKAGHASVPVGASAYETADLLIRSTWESHYVNTAFQKEMAALSAQSEDLRAIEQKYRGSMAPFIASFLEENRNFCRVNDYQTAGLLVQTALEAVIHEVIFYPNHYDKETVIKELTEMFCLYLIKSEYLI